MRLAALLRQPVVLMLGLYCGGNRYDVVFEPVADFSAVDRTSGPLAVTTALAGPFDLGRPRG